MSPYDDGYFEALNKTAISTSAIDRAQQLLDLDHAFAFVRFPSEADPVLYPYLIKGELPAHYFVVHAWDADTPAAFFSAEAIKGTESTTISPTHADAVHTSYNDYRAQFGALQQLFREGDLKKAILSRTIVHELDSALNVLNAFSKLAFQYPDAMIFLINHPTDGTWIGASPELLLQCEGQHYQTLSLAGTKAATDASDWSEKEFEEHRFVSDHIRQVAASCSAKNIEEKGPYTIAAGPVKHLRTDFSFDMLAKNLGMNAFLEALHPTPAIAGWPIDEAIDAINRVEKHARKLYCGYIGQVKANSGKFYVSLRCAEIRDRKLICYSGGGITAQSHLALEWKETQLKAETLISVFKDEQ